MQMPFLLIKDLFLSVFQFLGYPYLGSQHRCDEINRFYYFDCYYYCCHLRYCLYLRYLRHSHCYYLYFQPNLGLSLCFSLDLNGYCCLYLYYCCLQLHCWNYCLQHGCCCLSDSHERVLLYQFSRIDLILIVISLHKWQIFKS